MLIKYPDSYDGTIEAGLNRIAEITEIISHKEAFMGRSKEIDKLYALSIVIEALIDHLYFDDNSDPSINESFLQDLNNIIQITI